MMQIIFFDENIHVFEAAFHLTFVTKNCQNGEFVYSLKIVH